MVVQIGNVVPRSAGATEGVELDITHTHIQAQQEG